MEDNIKSKIKTLFWCPRCKHDSLGNQMCPCPRGSCEAVTAGIITIVTTITKNRNYGK